jgi:2-polyprenyl-3-methyl-5-hydroxy-6-metoxy-1,4-benzoquinol methylase
LPYIIDERANRYHFYENHWKQTGLDLLLKHYRPQGKTLLDYGCGRGELLALAGKAGFSAMGADIDPECVRLGAQYGTTCQLKLGDPVAQFGAKSFDVVACFHVLEHVDNPKLVLNGLRQVAREYVIVAVPNLRHLLCLFQRRIRLAYVNEGHLQSWDHFHFLNLAERHCGLQLVEWGFDATLLPVVSQLTATILGNKAAIWLETGLFRFLLPFHGVSVLGLFKPAS